MLRHESVKGWTASRVLAAAKEWVWVPDDARQVVTAEYHLIAYPDWFAHPTQVAWCRSTRAADELIREVADHVRRWGRDRVGWWLSANTQPSDLGDRLQALGADRGETVDVLAFDMIEGLPVVGDLEGIRCVVVDDERGLRAAQAVSRQVWGEEPTSEAIAKELADLARPARERPGFRVIAYIGDELVATGGCTQDGKVARLWGAATRPGLRGRGAYRAVLLTRLAVARQRGATLGLVKGKIDTSGPILRKLGFRAYGQEQLYDLPASVALGR